MHKEATKIRSQYFRAIHTKRPTIDLYEKIAPEADFEILNEIESLTNPRIREERGETHIFAQDDAPACQNCSLVDATFTDFSINAQGRFNDGTYGVFYCADSQMTALEESLYHTRVRLQSTDEKPQTIQKRIIQGEIEGEFSDIRKADFPQIYAANSYIESQKFALKIKEKNLDGIAYDSVRYRNGECFAVFKRNVVKSANETRVITFLYDGDWFKELD